MIAIPMRAARSWFLVILTACAASAVYAVPRSLVGTNTLQQLKERFGGTWTYIPDASESGLKTIVGRSADVSMLPSLSFLRQLVERTSAEHGLTVDDFDFKVVPRQLGRVQQILLPQVIDGRRVENAHLLISINPTAKTLRIIPQTILRQRPPAVTRGAEEAEAIVQHILCVDLGFELRLPADYGSQKCVLPESVSFDVIADPETRYLSAAGKVHAVYHVEASATRHSDSADETLALREYDISAVDGPIADALVRERDRIHKATSGTCRIFNPSPMIVKRRPPIKPEVIRDDDCAYEEAALTDLDDPVNGDYTLKGKYVAIVELEGAVAPKTRQTSVRLDAPHFCYSRLDTTDFASVMAYHHLTVLQHEAEQMGFEKLLQKPLRVDVLAGSASVIPYIASVAAFRDGKSGSIGDGYIVFGLFQPTIDSLVSDAEDAEIIAHEYGHALLHHAALGFFNITGKGAFKGSEAKAVDEGFADFWSLSWFASRTKAAKQDWRCFGEWGHAGTCYRKIGKRVFYSAFKPQEDEHTNGLIWASTLLRIMENVFKGDRRQTQILVLQGHLNAMNVGEVPSMRSMAEGILVADDEEFAGRNRKALCEVFRKHGLEPDSCWRKSR